MNANFWNKAAGLYDFFETVYNGKVYREFPLKVAEFIKEHYDQAVFMTAAKIGELLDISESTVVRFASGLGFEGYPAFQAELADWVKNKLNTVEIKLVIVTHKPTFFIFLPQTIALPKTLPKSIKLKNGINARFIPFLLY